MKNNSMTRDVVVFLRSLLLVGGAVLAVGASQALCASQASAQFVEGEFAVYDRARGEISPETQAPRHDTIVAAIRAAESTPSALASLLEYGERVECHRCVPELQRVLLSPRATSDTRRMAAWWLRRRPFAVGATFTAMRDVLASDTDATRRRFAAEALGELMDVHGVALLGRAVMSDADAAVRASAVRGIARINASSGLGYISAALADASAAVQTAALDAALQASFFRDVEALMGPLASEDATVRRRAARVLGTMRADESVIALAAMLRGDADRSARQAAAWALGRVDSAEARTALSDAQVTERDQRVLDAIAIALR